MVWGGEGACLVWRGDGQCPSHTHHRPAVGGTGAGRPLSLVLLEVGFGDATQAGGHWWRGEGHANSPVTSLSQCVPPSSRHLSPPSVPTPPLPTPPPPKLGLVGDTSDAPTSSKCPQCPHSSYFPPKTGTSRCGDTLATAPSTMSPAHPLGWGWPCPHAIPRYSGTLRSCGLTMAGCSGLSCRRTCRSRGLSSKYAWGGGKNRGGAMVVAAL